MSGSIIEGAVVLVVLLYVGLWLRGKLAQARAETGDEREARDRDVDDMVNSALGSWPRRKTPVHGDS